MELFRGIEYAVSAMCVLVAWTIRYLLTPVVGGRAAFIIFVPPALIAGWYGGVGPGIAALVAGLLLGEFFSSIPVQPPRSLTASEFTLMLIYICTAAVGLGIINNLHRARRRVEQTLSSYRRFDRRSCPACAGGGSAPGKRGVGESPV